MVIDARNKLKPEDISVFLSNCDDRIDIKYYAEGQDSTESIVLASILKADFVKTLFSLSDFKDTDNVVCWTDSCGLLLKGVDVNWWRENSRRLNKMMKITAEVSAPVPEKQYKIGIATLIEGTLSQVKVIEGNKDTIVSMLNDDIKSRYIDSFLKSNVVLDIDYQEGDESNIPIWLTLDELTSLGVLTLQ